MYCVYYKDGNLSGVQSGTKWIFNDWTVYMYIETDIILSVINNDKKYLQSNGGQNVFIFIFNR